MPERDNAPAVISAPALPKIDVKATRIVKDLSQILFQIAVSAKVILGL